MKDFLDLLDLAENRYSKRFFDSLLVEQEF